MTVYLSLSLPNNNIHKKKETSYVLFLPQRCSGYCSNQFDLRVPSSSGVPVLWLNQPNDNRASFTGPWFVTSIRKKKERKTRLNKANKGKQPYRVSEITVNEDHLWKVAAG